jgi:hypothetical protein
MKLPAVLLLLAAAGQAQIAPPASKAAPLPPSIGSRPMPIALGTFTELERRFDDKFRSIGGPNDPLDLLGTTRGIYLQGYGVVFTAELSLVITPSINPFRPAISDELKKQVHQRKVARVPALKQAMQEMLKTAALTMIQVSDAQEFVLAVRVDYLKWEDTMGLPGLIVMKADRKGALSGEVKTEEQ